MPFISGMTVPKLNQGRLREIPIPIPPLEEQQRIVAVLDEAFEGLARARAHAEANLQNARELFESALGALFERDETASVQTVGALVEAGILDKPLDGNHGETHPKKADFVKSGVPFIMASDLKNGKVDQVGCHHIAREQADSLRKGFAKDGDVLLSHKGTIGRTAILETDLDYVMLTPQVTYYRTTDQDKLSREYLYFAFQSGPFQKQIKEEAGGGATRAYIGITKQLDLKLPIPAIENQISLSKDARKIEACAKKALADYEAKLEGLADLRQSLLHKAFAGELT
jgi:type I restriction enzyme S subunit